MQNEKFLKNTSSLKLHPLSLSFQGKQKELEKPFQNDFFYSSIFIYRLSIILSIFFYAIFAILDHYLLPQKQEILWFIRFAVFIPYAVFSLIITYTPFFKKLFLPLFFLFVLTAGGGIIAMVIIAEPPVSYSYYAGLILVFMFLYLLARILFVWASLLGWSLVILYEIAAIVMTNTPIEVLINNNFFFIGANIIGMVSCYLSEFNIRKNYFLNYQILEERDKTKLAKIAADDANKAKSIFLSQMSHELRTPLNSILGFSQILLMKKEDSLCTKQIEYVNKINKNGNHLLELITEILDFSKIEYGKMKVEIQKMQIKPLLEELKSDLFPLFQKKDLQFELKVEEKLNFINADKIRLKQIVYNLLSNSIKFTDKGKKIFLNASITGKNNLQLIVRDEGRGISESEWETVFKPFEQSSGNYNKGTGLGLAITKKLVELHKGNIELKSIVGQGSTFTIILPGCIIL